MGGTELKTDSLQRWMMYSKNAYGSGRILDRVKDAQKALKLLKDNRFKK